MMKSIFIFLLVTKASAYTISYWDCHQPTNIQEYDATVACDNAKLQPDTAPQQVYLLEKQTVQRLKGYKCAASVSTFTYFCGAWSHLKVAIPPEIQIPVQITPAQCRYMYHGHQTPESLFGIKRQIDINTINFFNYVSKGNMKTSSSNIACEGEDYRYEGRILKDSLQIQQVTITVEDEEYLVKGNKIESTSEHITLSCDAPSRECFTTQGTYIWTIEENHCEFEIIQSLPMNSILGTHYINHQHQLLINASEDITTSCGLRIQSTNMNNIFLTLDPGAAYLNAVHAADVDITANILAKVQYELHMLHNRITESNKNQLREICDQQLQTPKMIHLKDNQFIHRHGDIIYLTKCQLKNGVIAEETTCFEEIPLTNGQFVNPITKLSQNVSTPTLCSSHHPMKIKTREGKFVSLEPHIRPAPIPPTYHLVNEDNYQMEDLTESAIFTTTQLQSWESLQSFPNYKKSTLNRIMIGLCLGSEQCSSHNQPTRTTYSLTNLENRIKLNLWQEIQEIIKEYATYICLLALAINLTNLVVTVLSVCLTLVNAGPRAMLALAYKLCCNSSRQYSKIRKLTKARMKPAEQEELYNLNLH